MACSDDNSIVCISDKEVCKMAATIEKLIKAPAIIAIPVMAINKTNLIGPDITKIELEADSM
jgi:hypothetical protein